MNFLVDKDIAPPPMVETAIIASVNGEEVVALVPITTVVYGGASMRAYWHLNRYYVLWREASVLARKTLDDETVRKVCLPIKWWVKDGDGYKYELLVKYRQLGNLLLHAKGRSYRSK